MEAGVEALDMMAVDDGESTGTCAWSEPNLVSYSDKPSLVAIRTDVEDMRNMDGGWASSDWGGERGRVDVFEGESSARLYVASAVEVR